MTVEEKKKINMLAKGVSQATVAKKFGVSGLLGITFFGKRYMC